MGLPFLLAFLAVPVALHKTTVLPRSVATSLPAWLNENPRARVDVPPVAVELTSTIREAIRFGTRHRALRIGTGAVLLAEELRRAPQGMRTDDLVECRDRARFTGRWFARAADYVTVLSAWGLKP
jgi:hypothetical protein